MTARAGVGRAPERARCPAALREEREDVLRYIDGPEERQRVEEELFGGSGAGDEVAIRDVPPRRVDDAEAVQRAIDGEDEMGHAVDAARDWLVQEAQGAQVGAGALPNARLHAMPEGPPDHPATGTLFWDLLLPCLTKTFVVAATGAPNVDEVLGRLPGEGDVQMFVAPGAPPAAGAQFQWRAVDAVE